MALFDFLKNKKNTPSEKEQPASENKIEQEGGELFLLMQKYSAYVVNFIMMQSNGNYSPIAAYEKLDGEIIGYLYVMKENDESYNLSVQQTIVKMEEEFEKRISENQIKSYTIFYHSQFDNNDNHSVANNDNEFKAISIKYKSNNKLAGYTAVPYTFQKDEIVFQTILGLTAEQHQSIFKTQLEQGKNYFQDRIVMTPEIKVNEFGLKIKKVNNGDLRNTWAGIFGFNSHRTPEGQQRLREYAAVAFTQNPKIQLDDITIHEWDNGHLVLKAIKKGGEMITFMPVVKTSYTVDVVNKQINEWDNVQNLEAVITGGGRDTFGLKYFATDYAENRKTYLTNKKLDIRLSAILFVLDKKETTPPENQPEDSPPLSEDFAAYMPHEELYEFGCHNFIGILEDHKELNNLQMGSLNGYLLKIRLINHPEIKDFFTIDMFVNKENMRFEKLENGMSLTGMFQLQGEIAPPS